MIFSSLTFLTIFLPIVMCLYYLVKTTKHKNMILIIFSFLFYSWGEPIYVFLMIFSIINDYVHALLIEIHRGTKKSKYFLISSICINLLLLGFFKYGDLLVNIANGMFNLSIMPLDLPLPIGISFYTFQTMSYTIDVYRNNTKANKNLLSIATYVALFPQLIAGPIVRYTTIEHELEYREHSAEMFKTGLRRFVFGLSKKIIIANQIAIVVDQIFNGDYINVPTIVLWLGTIAYALQIYYDFSGYTDMAIGLGKMFGFHFLENFNYPYVSKSITEFWRRWHISLGSWFRDYVYIPLGGNRKRALFNVVFTWFLTGLWHGANFNYIIWGLYFGLVLLLEKYIFGKLIEKLPNVLKHLYCIAVVLISWPMFREENLTSMFNYLQGLFVYNPWIKGILIENYDEIFSVGLFFPIAILGCFIPIFLKKIRMNTFSSLALDIYTIAIFLISMSFLFGERYNPFIYFKF